MKINITTMGGLKKFQPAEKSLNVPENCTVEEVLERIGIASDQVQVVLINGSPQGDRSHPCQEDDSLTILPIVGGG